MRVVTKERNNPLNNSKTMCIFEFSDEDDVTLHSAWKHGFHSLVTERLSTFLRYDVSTD